MRPFRFGVQALPSGGPGEYRDLAKRVEDLGYAELFTADHLGAADPFLPLITAAEATSTLRLGPLVLNNEFHHTALLARAAATFDLFTDGRLVLGMGTGYQRSEHDAAGVELREPAPRVTRFEETLIVLRSLLDDGSAHLDGEEVTVSIDDLGVRPVDRVSLLVGGHGRRVVSIAARHADIFQFTGLTHAEGTGDPGAGGFHRAQLDERRRWLEEAAGDRFAEIDLSALVQIVVVGGGDEERTRAADRLALDPADLSELPFTLIGSFDQIVDQVVRLRESLGIHHYVIRDVEGFAPVVERLTGT